jgi:branched-subunit amino acid ABC-type transport system permease component
MRAWERVHGRGDPEVYDLEVMPKIQRMTVAQLISIIVTYVCLFSVGILVSFTRFGRALRAMVQDRETTAEALHRLVKVLG